MKKYILFVFILFSFLGFSQSPIGLWKSIDDKTGEAKSLIKIYESEGKLFGKVEKILKKGTDQNQKCTECKGNKKNQPVVGMVLIENLVKSGEKWKNGTIVDPENGNSYNCSIWFDKNVNDKLNLRGYHWTGLYRTQQWHRVK